MAIHTVFGFRSGNLQAIRDQIATELSIELERRERDYLGGEYYVRKTPAGQKLSLQKNFCDAEGWTLPERQELLAVLYVSEEVGSESMAQQCAGLSEQAALIEWRVIEETDGGRRVSVYDGAGDLVSRRVVGGAKR